MYVIPKFNGNPIKERETKKDKEIAKQYAIQRSGSQIHSEHHQMNNINQSE